MSMQKRALASSSSGQPSQPKRPCLHPVDEAWNGSETNPLLSCYLTKEDVRSVVREELEHAKSHSAEFQSCTGHAFEDIAQLMHSLEYNAQKLKEALKLAGIHCPYLASCTGRGLEDIAQQMHSLEDAVQKLKEVLEFASIHSPHVVRANTNSTGRNDVRNLQLQLGTKLSLPLFTGNKLEGDGGGHINVALINVNTGEVVTLGLESSIKLDVVVLEGDFNKDDEDNWTQEEFENHVVKQREGKRPLLTGDLLVKLERGVGKLGSFMFTDNSSWNRSKSFRIGLKVASGYCGNTRIREAKTEAFTVREHRGESYKKHYPPAPDDEIWRLEKIAKDGKLHQRLNEAGIRKVEDFLMQLFTDSKKLREILGKSITQKNWDILIDHARTCNMDQQTLFATHRLTAQEKERGDTIVKKALDNQNDVREFNGETFSGSMQKKNSSPSPSILASHVGLETSSHGSLHLGLAFSCILHATS